VRRVGPEHFAVVCFDVAKRRSKWMMSDFYGHVLVEPMHVEHGPGQLQAAIDQVRQVAKKNRIQDLVVAIERTGNYHRPIRRAFQQARFAGASFDVRMVHPFATKHHRLPADPGRKTDDTDLAAIFRATVNGYGLQEPPQDPLLIELQSLARHRRDLVAKRSAVMCQIREQLDACLPGYAALFDKLWENNVALHLACQLGSPQRFREAGVDGLARRLKKTKIRFQQRSLEPIVGWASQATEPDPQAPVHHRILLDLEEDRGRKTVQIAALEQHMAHLLVQVPYVLLLCCPGINVITAAELAGEMGAIENYATCKNITGRAGLYPSRYQSDQVDCPDGPLIRMANRRLRFILMLIADNLILCNPHFSSLAAGWRAAKHDPRVIRTRIACRVARIVFQLVAGRQVLHHPGMKNRDYILDKLIRFHQEHGTPLPAMMQDLHHATGQLPATSYAEESRPLAQRLAQRAARRGPVPLADILPAVLARLGVGKVQSEAKEQEPSPPQTDA
jgi:transposase